MRRTLAVMVFLSLAAVTIALPWGALADVVINSAPVMVCRDLDQSVASDYAKKLKSAGDFRVWLETAVNKRTKRMNLKQKSGPAPMQAPHIRKH